MKCKLTKVSIIRGFICVALTGIFFFSFGLAGRYPYNYANIILWGVLGVLYFVWRRITKIKVFKFRLDIFFIASVVFGLCQILSYALSGFISFSKTGLVCIISSILFYELLSDGAIPKKAVLACACIGAIGYLLLFAFIYHSSILHPNFSSRIGDYFDNQNEVGQNSALCAILLLGVGLSLKEWYLKIIAVFFSLLSFYFTLLTGSVSSFLVLSIATLVSLPFYFKKRKWVIAIAEAVVIILGITVIFTVPSFSYYSSRITSILSSFGIGSGKGDSSAEGRFTAAIYGLRIFIEHPLFGAGYNAVNRSYALVAHNNFVEVLADFGIFAFLAHESTIVIPLVKLQKDGSPYKKVILPFLLFALLFQFFLFTFDSKPTNLLIVLSFFLVFPDGCYTKEMKRASIKTTKINI